jgi:threonine synthase
LKREDANPTGSHKARGAAFQVAALAAEGAATVVISSSGNAAAAVAAYSALAGLRAVAFLAPGTPPAKLAAVTRVGARIVVSPNALGLAEEVAKVAGWPNLRPSTHPLAVPGYMTLGWELAEEAPDAEAVFLFVASGATLVGLHRAFAAKPDNLVEPAAQLHVVQGAGASPIVSALTRAEDTAIDGGSTGHKPEGRRADETRSRLGALGARKTRRVGEAARAVRETGGRGWVIADGDAEATKKRLASFGVDTSLEGAAAVAAAARSAREGGPARVVAVLTGHASTADDAADVDWSLVCEAPDAAAALAFVEGT